MRRSATPAEWLPVYPAAADTPNINTIEGWRALCRETDIKHLWRRHGYLPTETEVEEHQNRINKAAAAAVAAMVERAKT